MTAHDQENWPQASEPFAPDRPSPRKELLPKRVAATGGFLLGCIPRRRSGRRALGVLTVLMAFAGVALLSYPLITDFWANRRQSTLSKEFASKQVVDAYKRREIAVGGALTRIRIPKYGACSTCKKVNVIVVEGTTGNALRAGAGHYVNTPLPGERGNVAIAGHRTGFGEPFRWVDKLRPGDSIILETPVGDYYYEVMDEVDGHENPWVTFPKDFSVIAPTQESVLTLTTCDPPHTSLKRLIVRAKLVKTVVAG
ncbi:MAG: class E sortase [Actinomycetota bacterium]